MEKVYERVRKGKGERGKEKVSDELRRVYHQTIKKVGEDIEKLNFNTAVSALMVCVRAFEQATYLEPEMLEGFLKLLAPFAPYGTQEIWSEVLEKKGYIAQEAWPKWNEKYIQAKMVSMVCQIQGKKRAVFEVPAGSDKETVLQTVQHTIECKKYLEGKIISRIIFVPDKIINIII